MVCAMLENMRQLKLYKMTIEELTNTLSKYPKDLDLSQIKVSLGIERDPNMNRIQSAYIADYRIAGGKPWGYLQHMERQTNLADISKSLLQGLKLNKK